MPELRAKITADGRGFFSEFLKIGHYADKVGKQIASKFNNAFGAGMLTGVAFSKVMDFLTKPLETAKVIDEGAKRLKVTVEEYQMLDLAARDAGLSIDDFIAGIVDSNTPLEKATAMVTKYRDQIQFLQDDIDVLTGKGTEGFANDMNYAWVATSRWITKWMTKLMIGREIPMNDTNAAMEEYERQQSSDPYAPSPGLEAHLSGRYTRKAKPMSTSWDAPSVTARQQIGAYIGTEATLINVVQRQAQTLERIDRRVEAIEEAARSL